MTSAVMRMVALNLADGQLEQADHALCRHADGHRLPQGPMANHGPYDSRGSELVKALLHMRSACGWMLRLT